VHLQCVLRVRVNYIPANARFLVPRRALGTRYDVRIPAHQLQLLLVSEQRCAFLKLERRNNQ
jgi:hypothetical protein